MKTSSGFSETKKPPLAERIERKHKSMVDEQPINDNLKASLELARLGYPVFPCQVGGKKPATPHGVLDATTDQEFIRRWWGEENPRFNVAIATQGLCVLDVDGAENPFLATIPPDDLANASRQRTPREGLHAVYRQNGEALRNTQGKIAPNVDTRFDAAAKHPDRLREAQA